MTEYVRPVGAHRVAMEIRTYPREDEAFRADVTGLLRRFDRVRQVAAIPRRLEQLLAPGYPAVRCRYQDPLASSSGLAVLYVFRDGALVRPAQAAAAAGGPDGAHVASSPPSSNTPPPQAPAAVATAHAPSSSARVAASRDPGSAGHLVSGSARGAAS